MELLQLKYFLQAAQTENFSEVAKKNYIPQSAVSITIKKLENELDTKLFDRTGNSIRLNETGKIFYEHVKNSIYSLQSGIDAVKAAKNTVSGEIKLLVRTNRRFVTECISVFKEQYTDISFSLVHSFSNNRFLDFDLIISDDNIYDEPFEKKLLVNEEILLALPSSCRLADFEEIPAERLKDLKYISMIDESSLSRITKKICNNLGFEPNIILKSDDPSVLRSYINNGLGVAFVPSFSWFGAFGNSIALRRIENICVKRATYIYRPNMSEISPAANLFEQCMIKQINKIKRRKSNCESPMSARV